MYSIQKAFFFLLFLRSFNFKMDFFGNAFSSPLYKGALGRGSSYVSAPKYWCVQVWGAGGAVCRLVRMPPFSFCSECPPSVSWLVGGVRPASRNGVGLLGAGRGGQPALWVLKKTGRVSYIDITRK